MANTSPMTWAQIKSVLQTEIEQNTDTPDTDDAAYWLVVANRLIGDWENGAWDDGDIPEWDELWTYQTSGGTIADATSTYTVDAAVNYISEYIELVLTSGDTKYIRLADITDKQYYTRTNEQFAYLTGKAGTYTLNLSWTPATGDPEIGATIKFAYYKYATKLSADSDVVDMSNPNWLIDAVTSEVSNSPNKKALFGNRAAQIFMKMRRINDRFYDQLVPDQEPPLGV